MQELQRAVNCLSFCSAVSCGSGSFEVLDVEDRWARVHCQCLGHPGKWALDGSSKA